MAAWENKRPRSAINKKLSNPSQRGGFVSEPADGREPEQRSTSPTPLLPAAAETSIDDTTAAMTSGSGGTPDTESTEARAGAGAEAEAEAEQAAIEAIKAIEAGAEVVGTGDGDGGGSGWAW